MRPRFRHRRNLHTLRYKRVDLDHADAAWRRLVAGGQEHLRLAPVIAQAMGVGRNLAVVYRRLWHILHLIEDVPGRWNPEPLDDLGAGMGFDGSSIEDGPEGYEDWTDWESVNDPAEVWLRTFAPEAFRRAVTGLVDGRDLDVYVASRYIERGSPPADNTSAARFARWSEVPATVWFAQEHAERWGLEQLAHGRSDDNFKYYYTYRCPSSGELLPPTPSDAAPGLLLLAPSRDSRRRTDHASEASTARSRQQSVDGTVGVNDLMATMGYSRATAKRRLTLWQDEDLVEKVAYGKYRWKELRPELPGSAT